MNGIWIILGIIGAACILLIVNHDSGLVFGMESGRFANLIWLGAFGALIGAAILPRRGQFKIFARNMTIWLVIILMLMAGYVYRYELQDIASRLTAGIVPGSPVSSISAQGRDQTMLIRTGDGHFAADGYVNGLPVHFLIDTGASVVVLTSDAAQDIGIDIDDLRYTAPVRTANGRTTAAAVTLDEIQVGDITRRRVPAMVAQPNALETSLLGMSFLSTLRAYEFRGDRLILTD